MKLRNQGMILAEDGRKMSKSLGNVVNPDDAVAVFGADSLRIFEMFMGPLEDAKPWNTQGIVGVKRFLERIWRLQEKITDEDGKSIRSLVQKTIKKVGDDIEMMKFNTAISAMMILVNEAEKIGMTRESYRLFVKILSPFAPHIAEEIWGKLGNAESVFVSAWPDYDPGLIKDEEINLVVQVNGKMRDMLKVGADIDQDGAKAVALESEKIKAYVAGKEIRKIIFVPGKLLNIVV
ncbi:MAG: class I tRNA ligase family protein [bacterium]|nr:class I tRNA ligase family protein [bacterium]